MNEKDIYIKAIKLYGIEKQLDMVIEECLELSHEILKKKRGKDNIKDLMSELVDTGIMINQLKVILNDDDCYNLIKKFKLKRLEERMNKRL